MVPHQNVPLWKPATPSGIGYHRHLYTRVIGPSESDEIERWFNTDFENPAKEAIQKVAFGSRLSKAEWLILIKFLAAQDVRTPARMLEILRRGEKIVPEIANNILENIEQEFTELKRTGNLPKPSKNKPSDLFPIKVISELPPNQDYGTIRVEASIGRGYWLYTMKHQLTSTIDKLLQHKWTILRSPDGVEWLTSDDPVVKLNYNSPQEFDFGGGWGSNGTEIFMPLSPKHLLYTRIGVKQLPRGTVLPIEQAIEFQRIIAKHAHRYIYSTSQNLLTSQFRPRTVNLEMFKSEKQQWENWHLQNIEAENNL